MPSAPSKGGQGNYGELQAAFRRTCPRVPLREDGYDGELPESQSSSLVSQKERIGSSVKHGDDDELGAAAASALSPSSRAGLPPLVGLRGRHHACCDACNR